MELLSIDPGSKFLGYAFFKGKRLHETGFYDYSKLEDYKEKLLKIYKDIENLLLIYNPDQVVVEAQKHFLNAKTSRVLNEIMGVIKVKCYQHYNTNISEVHPMTMKKVITGNGKGSKDEVKQTIMKKFKLKDITQDQADAIGLGWAYLEKNK